MLTGNYIIVKFCKLVCGFLRIQRLFDESFLWSLSILNITHQLLLVSIKFRLTALFSDCLCLVLCDTSNKVWGESLNLWNSSAFIYEASSTTIVICYRLNIFFDLSYVIYFFSVNFIYYSIQYNPRGTACFVKFFQFVVFNEKFWNEFGIFYWVNILVGPWSDQKVLCRVSFISWRSLWVHVSGDGIAPSIFTISLTSISEIK